ncbi:aminoglycoside phosphotransferase family protein [Roseovarius sp. SYSU LYC5161]|uniref:aminoglycoside phosphotransferase family protein n=1 Tax=Roseovarius halophilus (ex Wu et al. 2025) TaxID=3376060 RepID=UPI003999789A
MTTRDALISRFLDKAGWADATRAPLAGDASNRRYLRLSRADTGETSVLMDAPPDRGEDIGPFMRIAGHLQSHGFSAPRLLSWDDAAGLLLLEDLGDDLFARVVQRAPGAEDSLYSCATDLLARLHEVPPPSGLPPYDTSLMSDLAKLAWDWYLPAATGIDATDNTAFKGAMRAALDHDAPDADVLIQRDYHAENLLWLPDRTGTARVGLLDFQDAMRGHRAYDLVSLLQDARRDVPAETEDRMLARYITATGVDDDAFRAAYACLGAQRNLRIIGVFTRLCLRDGKAHYIDMLPRVWGLLERDLAAPGLSTLATRVHAAMPAPTPAILQRLKDQCQTIPAQ